MNRRDSRGLILGAARQEFGQRGYAGGRVDRIARRAGVNKQLIFYYFGSKAGLFKAVVESASPDLALDAGAAHVSGGPLDQLRAVLERSFSALAANADLLRATVVASETGEGSRALLAEQLGRLGETIRAVVSDAQGLGYVRDDVDPGVVAHLAVATAVGSVVLPGASGDQRLRSEIDLLIRGLAW